MGIRGLPTRNCYYPQLPSSISRETPVKGMGKEPLSKVVYRDGILTIMPSLTNLQDLSTTFFFLVGDANHSDFYTLSILLGLSLINVVIILSLPVSNSLF